MIWAHQLFFPLLLEIYGKVFINFRLRSLANVHRVFNTKILPKLFIDRFADFVARLFQYVYLKISYSHFGPMLASPDISEMRFLSL